MTDLLQSYLALASLLISVGGTIYAWLTRSGREAVERVSTLEGRIDLAVKERDRKIDALEDRVSRIEGELKGVPDRESVHRMQLEMERMRGTIEVLNERLIPLAAISGRLQEFLLEQAKGH